jgi:hypothetical protein
MIGGMTDGSEGLGGPSGPVGQALRQVVETIAATGPAGWSEATLSCTAGGRGFEAAGIRREAGTDRVE